MFKSNYKLIIPNAAFNIKVTSTKSTFPDSSASAALAAFSSEKFSIPRAAFKTSCASIRVTLPLLSTSPIR